MRCSVPRGGDLALPASALGGRLHFGIRDKDYAFRVPWLLFVASALGGRLGFGIRDKDYAFRVPWLLFVGYLQGVLGINRV